MNSEIVKCLPGYKLRGEPAWLFPATRPGLSKIFRISVFRKYLWVWAAGAMSLRLQLTQPFVKLCLLRHEPAAQSDYYLLTKLPQLL